ncbi:MAG: 30S ribosomal protein S6 [Gemmatimonadota bacterium]|nr:30S ribosomal protein S6 [Gemmatimonadota bacterium]
MSRTYESVIIFDSTLPESEIEGRVERFRETLVGEEDGSFDVDHWGKRKLAYPIRNDEQGIYSVLRYEAEPDAVKEFDRIAKLDEMVLRHLTVVNPPEAPSASESGEEE